MSSINLSPYNRESVYTISYRPLRIAFLIPQDDKEFFLRCIRINCSLWGGQLNIFVPLEPILKNDENDFWHIILKKFKPDNIVLPNQCNDEHKEELAKRFDVFHVETIDGILNSHAPTAHYGISIYSFFEQEKYYLNKDARKRIVFFNYSDKEHCDELRFATTFGSVSSGKTIEISPSFLREDIPYDAYVNLNEFTKDKASSADYINNVIAISEEKYFDFWGYTLVSGEKFNISLKSNDKGSGYRHPLIILSDGRLEDYMMAILMRNRIAQNPFFAPIIFDVTSPAIKEELAVLFNYLKQAKCSMCNFISLANPRINISDYIDLENFVTVGLNKQNILDRFNAELIFKYETKNICSLQKHMQIVLQKPQFFNILNNDECYIAEINFEGYKIPYKKDLNERSYSGTKVYQSGGLKKLTRGNHDERDFIMIPDIDSILYTLMVHKEIWPKETSIRRKMKAVAEYFESFWDLSIFSTKELQTLIFELKSPQSHYYAYKSGMMHGEICKIIRTVNSAQPFPGNLTDFFLATLIKKKIIFRGKEISCSKCHLKEWVLFDDLRNENICKGCSNPIGFVDISKTTWTYKLNQIFKENFDFTVFLSLMHLVGYKHTQLDNVIGYNFGFRAEIKNKLLIEKLNKKESMEFDFSIIENGKITIGECKQNPSDFSEDVVNSAIEFAKFTDIDRLVFASLGNLDELRKKFEGKDRGGLEIKILDEKDLLYLTAHLYRQTYESPKDPKLADLSKRREAFINQFNLIIQHKTQSPDSKIIGEYFTK